MFEGSIMTRYLNSIIRKLKLFQSPGLSIDYDSYKHTYIKHFVLSVSHESKVYWKLL